MAEWDSVKLSMRVTVHRQFARTALYRSSPAAMSSTDITARRHTKQMVIGDLDREGYAAVAQDVNAVILDLTEVTPVNGAVITFASDSSQWRIDHIEHSDDGRFVRCPVSAYDR
ncbi:MAG: hypothetical protein V4787_11655 [Pseudomonadota bacterium]